jgi:hypothetical protein
MMKIDLEDVVQGCMDSTDLAQNRYRQWALVNELTNLQVP